MKKALPCDTLEHVIPTNRQQKVVNWLRVFRQVNTD